MIRRLWLLFLLNICLGCNNTPDPGAVATVGMVADLVRNIGGDDIKVTQLLGSSTDPHNYEVTDLDVAILRRSPIIFYNGLLLEGRMTETLEGFSRQKPVYAVTEKLDKRFLLGSENFQGHYDPHVWMDVSAWSRCVLVVEKALCEYAPQHAEKFRARAAAYQKQLDELHEYGKKSIASIPKENRVLVTSHDAFRYFGRAYDIEVHGIQGISTEDPAALKRILELSDLLVKRKVKAVFVESTVPPKNVEALVEGARSKGHSVAVGGQLFSDAMGPEGTYEGTYIGMLDHNMTTITRALGGTAPDRGLHGKLAGK